MDAKTTKTESAKDALTMIALAVPIALLVLTNRKKSTALKNVAQPPTA
jgi:hypothetical protein